MPRATTISKWGTWLTAALCAAHAIGLVLLFDPVSGLFNTRPIIEQDYGLHFHHIMSIKAFWQQDGRLWGYNPLFMAGYPSNTIQDVSIKLFELIILLVPWINPIRIFKWLVFLSAAGVPILMHAAAQNFYIDESADKRSCAATIAAFLGTAYWWNSYPREMFFYGMVGFQTACYFALFALSWLYRFLIFEKTMLHAVIVFLTIFVLIPLHLQAAIILFVPASVLLFVAHIRDRPPAWRAPKIMFLAIALHSPWVLVYWAHRHDDVAAQLVDKLPVFTQISPWAAWTDYVSGALWTFRTSPWEKGLRWVLLVCGIWAIVELGRSKKGLLARMLGAGGASMFVLAFFGSLIVFTRSWQPLRFKIALDLYLAMACAFLPIKYFPGTFKPARVLLIAAGLIGLVCVTVNIVQTEKGSLKLRTNLSPQIGDIVGWVNSKTDINSRILFEESGDESGFRYDGMYLSAFIPYWTGRQLIGGPANLYNDRHHFAEFHNGLFFQHRIETMSNGAILAYLDDYNIRAVITYTPEAIAKFFAMSERLKFEMQLGDLAFFKVVEPAGWFLRGSGEVTATLNQIECTNVEGKEVVLKFHWIEGLESSPPLELEQEAILDDPIPFIRIQNPPANFTLKITDRY